MPDTTFALDAHRELTQAELVEEARARFGDDPMDWAFICPNCRDVATAGDFPKDKRNSLGQVCVGRFRGALSGPANPSGRGQGERGCDWAANGLIAGPWTVEMPDGSKTFGFALAPARAESGA